MADTIHDDVHALKIWREDVAEPAIEKTNTLWDERNYSKGALWVILGLSACTFAIVSGVVVWAVTHLHVSFAGN